MAATLLDETERMIERKEPLSLDEEAFLFPPETVVIPGAIKIEDQIVRYNLEVPESVAYNGIVGFVSGLGGFERTSVGMRKAMAQLGFATFNYEPARSGGDPCDPQQLHADTTMGIFADIGSRLDIRKQAPNPKGLEFDRQLVVAYSMGGLAAARCNGMEALINVAALGYGSPPLRQRIESVPNGLSNCLRSEVIALLGNGHIGPNIPTLRHAFNYFLRWQTLPEVVSCVTSSVEAEVARLREDGVLVGYEAYERDIVVPPNAHIDTLVDKYKVVVGLGHMAPVTHPEKAAVEVKRQIREFDLVA